MFVFVFLLLMCFKCYCIEVSVTTPAIKRNLKISLSLPHIDGDISDVKALQITKMSFENYDKFENIENITIIKNFLLLKEVHITPAILITEVPIFENLPNLEYISIYRNNIVKLKNTAFSQTVLSIIDISSNFIKDIEDYSFGKNVSVVNLSCNFLKTFTSRWFLDPSKLISINLYANEVQYLEENLLQNFTLLKTLRLDNNEIKTIGNGALSGPVNMDSLSLDINFITELNPSVFSASKNRFKWFDVSHNRINYVSRAFLNKLEVEDFAIYGNPIQCPCLEVLNEWLRETNSSEIRNDRSEPVCVYALSFSHICIEANDPELFEQFKKAARVTFVKDCPHSVFSEL